jgi:hypothetical protein
LSVTLFDRPAARCTFQPAFTTTSSGSNYRAGTVKYGDKYRVAIVGRAASTKTVTVNFSGTGLNGTFRVYAYTLGSVPVSLNGNLVTYPYTTVTAANGSLSLNFPAKSLVVLVQQ